MAITLVQQQTASQASGTSLVVNLGQSTVAGNTLVACVGAGTIVSGITGGGTWTYIDNSSSYNNAWVWVCPNCTATSSVTITLATGICSANVSEWSGLVASPVDTHGNYAEAGVAIVTATVTPTVATNLVVAMTVQNVNGTYVSGPSGSWTGLTKVATNIGLFPGYIVQAAATAAYTGWSCSNEAYGKDSVIVAFKGVTATNAPAGLASGTGSSYQAGVSENAPAGLAAGTGAAYQSAAKANVSAGLASGTGAALGTTMQYAPAGVAAATGAAPTPNAGTQPNAAPATGTGAAPSPATSIKPNAGLAAGTGAALGTAMQYAPAGSATGTGAANNVTATGGGSAISLVQQQVASQASGVSLVVTLAQATASGNTLVACCGSDSIISGISGGGTWSLIDYSTTSNNAWVWVCPNCTATSSVTITLATGICSANVSEWSGLVASPVDTHGNYAAAGVAIVTATVTPSVSKNVVIAMTTQNPNGTYVSGPSGAWTGLTRVATNIGLFPGYIVQAAATAAYTGWSCSNEAYGKDSVIVVLKGSSGVSAPAGLASGTGAGYNVTTLGTTAPAGLASGTGTAYNPTTSNGTGVNAQAGLASGTGTVPSSLIIYDDVDAGVAAGTGAAYNPTIGTGATYVNAPAGLAGGSGAAYGVSSSGSVVIVVPVVPVVPSTTLEISVWDGATPTIKLAILDGAASVKWTDLLADVGSGSCELSAYDPKAPYCSEGNLIKFNLGGAPVFGYFIEAPVLLSGEAADYKWTLAGQSVLAYTRYGEVYPAGWTGNGTYAVVRSWTGATYGTILKTLIDEAKARGTIPAMTYDFTATLDSAGIAWTADRTLTIDVGSSLLDVTKKFVALGMGVSMDPQLVLHAYVPGSQGANLASTVIWRQGLHFRAPVSNTGNRANMSSVALVRGTVTAGSAPFIECTDPVTTGNPYIGRRESPLDYSTVSSDSTLMTSAGNQQIALTETASQAITVQLTHGPSSTGLYEPYRDYHNGDTIALDVPGSYSLTPARIVAITVEQTPNNYNVDAALGSIVVPLDLQLRQLLSSVSGSSSALAGGVAGNLNLASPKR